MSGQPESERERICREQVVECLRRLGLEVVCGPKRDDDPPDYDLTVGGTEYAFEVTTLADSDPDIGTFITTREHRMAALARRIDRCAREEGILIGEYVLDYPREPFGDVGKAERTIYDRAMRALRMDADLGGVGPRWELLWYPDEEVVERIPEALGIGRTRLGVPWPLARDARKVRLVRLRRSQYRRVTASNPLRTRVGDSSDLARDELVPLIEGIAAKKAEALREKGDQRPWVLALPNAHVVTALSDCAEAFVKMGDPKGFHEIFVVGGGEARPLLGNFALAN